MDGAHFRKELEAELRTVVPGCSVAVQCTPFEALEDPAAEVSTGIARVHRRGDVTVGSLDSLTNVTRGLSVNSPGNEHG